jgi:hypothetical protein
MIVRVVALLTLIGITGANGATLDQSTAKAWDQYVQSATARMQQRLKDGNCFLWVDESPERLARVRSGEIVIAPVGPQNPKKVASGLIHDWMGAMFIPQASIHDVLHVVRDYGRYKDLYEPDVAESKTIAAGDMSSAGANDRFSMVLINKSLSLKIALDAEYESTFVRLDDRRVYDIADTTRVQEISDYGSPEQKLLPEGTGHGLIWRMFAISRYMQRDGGVYIEFEALALSRDIPGSIRWLVEPLVRRLSRNSLSVSLRETQKAVRNQAEVASDR